MFPALENINKNPTFKKSYNEWCSLERHKGIGINDQIQAPNGLHDDHPNADALAVFAANKMSTFKGASAGAYKFPKVQISKNLSAMNPGMNKTEPRYLPNSQISCEEK